MFYVGQKVACVKDISPWAKSHKGILAGTVLTVRCAGDDGDPKGAWVRLFEVVNPTVLGTLWNGQAVMAEGVYSASSFRLLTDIKQSVSFTTGADPSTDKFDNRRKQKERV